VHPDSPALAMIGDPLASGRCWGHSVGIAPRRALPDLTTGSALVRSGEGRNFDAVREIIQYHDTRKRCSCGHLALRFAANVAVVVDPRRPSNLWSGHEFTVGASVGRGCCYGRWCRVRDVKAWT
jgi:hypothetical protein